MGFTYQYSNNDFRGFEAGLRLQDFTASLPGLAAFNKHNCSFYHVLRVTVMIYHASLLINYYNNSVVLL